MSCPARNSPLRSAPSLRRDCPHSGRSSLQRTDSAALRSLERSHQSPPADSSCVADCLQSPLPYPLQPAPLPLRPSPCSGGRTRPCERCCILPLFAGKCKLANTFIPRFNFLTALACRGLRPCPLHTFASREDAATAATSQLSKVHRPTKLTHAASVVPIRPASPARRESRLCIYTGNGKRLPPPRPILLLESRKFAIFVLLA